MNKIIDFQKANGLKPDGDIGPKTAEKLMSELGILTIEHLSHFLGQVAHETGGFSVDSENLMYSKERLVVVFPKYFNEATAALYARNPSKIANKVYANRMGNGNEASGDGYKYRGRGAIQLTGKGNYEAFAKFIGVPQIVDNPDLVATQFYFESAFWFFSKNKIWPLCTIVNDQAIKAVTRVVNGGQNGINDRVKQTNKFYENLNK